VVAIAGGVAVARVIASLLVVVGVGAAVGAGRVAPLLLLLELRTLFGALRHGGIRGCGAGGGGTVEGKEERGRKRKRKGGRRFVLVWRGSPRFLLGLHGTGDGSNLNKIIFYLRGK
jgi:hypothetical protein